MNKVVTTFMTSNATNMSRPILKIERCPRCQGKNITLLFTDLVGCSDCNLDFEITDFEICDDMENILSVQEKIAILKEFRDLF